MRLRKPIIAVTVISAFALAACGGGDGDGNDDGGDGGSGSSAEPSDETSQKVDRANEGGNTGNGQDPTAKGPVELEGATEGGTVKVISAAGLNTMDPSEAYYQNTTSILTGLVTRSLTQYKYDAEEDTMILVPDLATDLGTPSEDFKTWTFELQEGLKYEDGSPIKAEDFIYSAARSMDRTQFPEGPAFSNDYFVGGDTYEGPYTGNGLDGFSAVTVKGNVITYKMRTPFPDLPYWLSFAAMGPIPEAKASDPAAYALKPLASGPYKFDEYTPEKSLTLVRNDQWDPNSDAARTQYPDGYEFNFQTASEKIDELLLSDNGDAQTTMTYDDVLANNFKAFNDSGRLEIGGFPLTSYWAPDYRKITDLKVRQALAYAYPYDDAYLAAGLIKGVTAIPGQGLLPPGTPGRVDFEAIEGYETGTTDTDKARALLEEAGAVGYEIKWPYAKDDQQAVATKDTIVASLEKAGFKASPVPSTVADVSTVRADPDADINVRPAGWIADWPSGATWFPPLLQSTNLKAEGVGSNYSVFSEQAVDDKIQEILESPIEEQPDAWGALDEEVMTTYFPLFVTRYGGVAQAHGSKIEGHSIDNTIGMPTWKDIHVVQ
ncbi:ABC transporter substrate-binding protein [Nocardioides marinquilinus]|uniref:ABC transporter substrate-binding protein n=1 Tax=Nocardioides marinquilinus TaxID=1210400 RepID=A0ABP9PW12_9ACTN